MSAKLKSARACLLGVAAGALLGGGLPALADAPAQVYKPGFVSVEWSETNGEKWTVEGLADRESGRPMTRDTVFAICSNTKPVASVFALTFVEEGLFDLDDPVSKYFPEFANIKYKGKPPKRPVTLRHLLTHLSGLAYTGATKDRKPDMVPYEEQVKVAVQKGLRSEPGEAYQYCGLGFQVMAAVIEKLTGRKVPDLMKERIFDPLGMTETTFYPSEKMLERLAIPYYYPAEDVKPIRFEISKIWTPPMDNRARTALLSGGLFSTVDDYLKFSQMMVRKGVGVNGKRILSEKMFDDYLLKRQTPPGDKVNSSFDIGFNKAHTSGSKGGLFATSARWNWADRSCIVKFKAKNVCIPKNILDEVAKTKHGKVKTGGPKTTFSVTDVVIADGRASCQVGNREDRFGIAVVKLVVNGKEVARKQVELAIGETKSVEFSYAAKPDDKVTFKAVSL